MSNQQLIESYTKKIEYVNRLDANVKSYIKEARSYAGHKILTPTTNMTRISALTDKDKYISEAFNRACRSNATPAGLAISKPHVQDNYGICLGMCLDFAKRASERGLDPRSLLEIANKFRFGGGTKAFGAQEAYHIVKGEMATHPDGDNVAVTNVAKTFDLSYEPLHTIDRPDREHQSKPETYASLHLDTLENGIYEISLPTFSNSKRGGHSILLIKQENQNFFFDPNLGVIQPQNNNCTECFRDLICHYNEYFGIRDGPPPPGRPVQVALIQTLPPEQRLNY